MVFDKYFSGGFLKEYRHKKPVLLLAPAVLGELNGVIEG